MKYTDTDHYDRFIASLDSPNSCPHEQRLILGNKQHVCVSNFHFVDERIGTLMCG